MRRVNTVWLQLIGVSCLFLLMNTNVIAHDNVVVIPLNGGSNKIQNNTSPCDFSTAGVIRWTGSDFEGCNGEDWTPLSAVSTVYSSGHAWMDRNLGASQVATSSTDTAAYGDMYQWGRYADGHESRTSLETSIQSSGDVPGHDMFIKGSSNWRSSANDTLWQADSGLNNPCPAGFRVPTQTEWNTERLSWSTSDSAGAYSSPLKLIMTGSRNYSLGTVTDADIVGYYWSSTVGTANVAYRLIFDSSSASVATQYRAFGMSVRCLKD